MKGRGTRFAIALGFAVMFLCIAAASDAAMVLSNNTTNIGNIIILNAESPDPTVNGTALLNTLAGLTGSPTDRYVIRLGPGTYDVGSTILFMKDYVDIEGSGEAVTVITGNPDNAATVVAIALGNAELRFLSVKNTGGGTNAAAIGTSGNVNITHVSAEAKGSTNNYAVHNICLSPPCGAVMMKEVYASVEDNNSTENDGIFNESGASVVMINVIADVSGTVNGTPGANTTSVGIKNVNTAQIIMMEVYAIVGGGANARGVRNNNVPGNSQMFNVYSFAMDATGSNYGIFNTNSALIMRNIRTEGSGGTNSIGISNQNCGSATTGVTTISAIGHNASVSNIGIENDGCSFAFFSSQASTVPAKNGAYHAGIKNVNSNTIIETSFIRAAFGADANCSGGCYGVDNTGTGLTFKIDSSQIYTVLTGSAAATIKNDSGWTTYVGNSKLEGNAVQNTGTIKCVGSYNATYDLLNNSTCL